MYLQKILFKTIFAILVVGSSVPAMADFIGDYEDINDLQSISLTGISEYSGTDDKALYGAPGFHAGSNIFWFTPSFISEANNGGQDTSSSTLSMTITAKEGYTITGVRIFEMGSYSLTGTGGANTWADIEGEMSVSTPSGYSTTTDLTVLNDDGHYSLSEGDTSGTYSAEADLDLAGLGFTELSFALSNDLATHSEYGTTALISKDTTIETVGVEIFTGQVPVPGALWLFGSAIAAIGVFRRRRS